jgi:hypothetical protein
LFVEFEIASGTKAMVALTQEQYIPDGYDPETSLL